MALTAETLRQAGVSMSPAELEELLLSTLREMRLRSPLPDPYREMTAEEIAALERGGFTLEPIEREGLDDPMARTAAKYTSLVATALTVNQAAARLGVNPSRIRQQLLDHTIYGIKVAHSWRLPLFQFDDDRLLPGVGDVFSRLDWTVHPVGVYNWFVNPDPDLQTDEDQAPLSPRDWLRSGRSPELVAELAAALGKGL
jgi:hypothetical protein